MRITNFLEAGPHLRIAKHALPTARGSYGSLIAVMDPRDFLMLSTPDTEHIKQMYSDKFASNVAAFRSGNGPFSYDNYNMPFLHVEFPTGKVKGHEGRHRAIMIAKEGGTKFPVMIYYRDVTRFRVAWTEYDNDGEATNKGQIVADRIEAGKIAHELENRDDVGRVTIETVGGYGLRGHPQRSDPSNWEYAAWQKTDVPPEFIGQFDDSVRVPTRRMRFGVVKGYNHYKR